MTCILKEKAFGILEAIRIPVQEPGLIHRRKAKAVQVLVAKRGSQCSKDREMALLRGANTGSKFHIRMISDFSFGFSLRSKLLGSCVLQPGIRSDSIFERVAEMERKS